MTNADFLSSLTHQQLARESFLYYLSYVFGLTPYSHIQKMVEEIEKPVRHSAIVIPPGFGKSTLVSQTYPSWYLGRYPDRSVLLISNTDKQAKIFLKSNIATWETNDRHRSVFPEVQPDFQRGWSIDGLFLKWQDETGTWQSKPATNKDPALSAFGVGGPVIGRRADLIIVDDMYSQETARSASQRAALLDWFRQTLLSRLKPADHCKVVIAMTRWHPDDLIAYLLDLNREGGDVPEGTGQGPQPHQAAG